MPEKIYLDLDDETVRRLDEDYGGNLEAALADRLPANRTSFALKATSILSTLAVVLLAVMFLNKSNQVQNLKAGNADFCEQAIGKSKEVAELNEQLYEFRAMLVKPVQSGVDIDGFAERLKPKDWWNRRLGSSGGTRLHRVVTAKKDNRFLFGIVDLEVALREGADINLNRFRANKNGGWKSGEATGQTPLMQMIAYGRWDMVEYVLTHHMDKIDKTACNFAGKTAADYVLQFGGDDKQELYALLKD